MEEIEISELDPEYASKLKDSIEENDWIFFVGNKEDALEMLEEYKGE